MSEPPTINWRPVSPDAKPERPASNTIYLLKQGSVKEARFLDDNVLTLLDRKATSWLNIYRNGYTHWTDHIPGPNK